jgi:Tn3 transposase DDE domain
MENRSIYDVHPEQYTTVLRELIRHENDVTNHRIMWLLVEQLKQEGYPVQESDLAHLWPTRYAHINVYGKYHFNLDEARRRQGLRPLRQPGHKES